MRVKSIIALGALTLLVGCSNESNTQSQNAVQTQMSSGAQSQTQTSSGAQSQTQMSSVAQGQTQSATQAASRLEVPSTLPSSGDINIDLTLLSDSEQYLMVTTMLRKPKDYAGNVVRIKGTFNVQKDVITNKYYYQVVVGDATCGAQGLEFVLSEGATYPNSDEKLTVVGTLATYEENGVTYCHLIDARIE